MKVKVKGDKANEGEGKLEGKGASEVASHNANCYSKSKVLLQVLL